ncbi:hypothetical protein L3X38_033246 [Prunus dulcis]|uniref:Uncharacterized protein n=1 Tax=Prunus dulcis TaxID=3755 RepID=A0AAD4YXF8_PRUDU|nr:hypothetical protein L3X38_033246 [Prunus dulcis]
MGVDRNNLRAQQLLEKGKNPKPPKKVRREEREEMEGALLPLVHPRLLSGLSEHMQAGVEKRIMLHREKDLVRVAELWRLRDEMGRRMQK